VTAGGIPTFTTEPGSEKSSFLQRYDLRLNLRGMDGVTQSEWEGITNLLLQMQAIDDTIELWPWAVKDRQHNLPIAITTIASSFFDLQIYVPGLASSKVNLRTRLELGDTRHPSLLLGSSVPPMQLVDNLGPWLHTTRQGMWIRQLPLAERTSCIGWLLYSAPEYNLSTLRQHIKQDTGIEVALRYRSISKDSSGHVDSTTTKTKAIHVEVDSDMLPSQRKRIKRVYSAGAKTFPVGIKMRLVPVDNAGTHNVHDNKVGQLIRLQARFLKYTETSWIREADSATTPLKCSLYNTLRAMTLPPGLAKQSRKPLFHAINPTKTNDGYLVRYLPQYQVLAQAAIDGLLNKPRTTPNASVSVPVTCKDQNTPASDTTPRSPGHMDAIDQWILSRFNTPLSPGSKLTLQQPSSSTQSIPFGPDPSPCHHKLLPWLAALRQQFLNTAWDRWRYRNGVK